MSVLDAFEFDPDHLWSDSSHQWYEEKTKGILRGFASLLSWDDDRLLRTRKIGNQGATANKSSTASTSEDRGANLLGASRFVRVMNQNCPQITDARLGSALSRIPLSFLNPSHPRANKLAKMMGRLVSFGFHGNVQGRATSDQRSWCTAMMRASNKLESLSFSIGLAKSISIFFAIDAGDPEEVEIFKVPPGALNNWIWVKWRSIPNIF